MVCKDLDKEVVVVYFKLTRPNQLERSVHCTVKHGHVTFPSAAYTHT